MRGPGAGGGTTFALGQDDLVECGTLGRGASGVVFRAYSFPHQQFVALKVRGVFLCLTFFYRIYLTCTLFDLICVLFCLFLFL
jgi:hypothetical protein